MLLESLLCEYKDKEVVEYIKYGWPINFPLERITLDACNKNHKGATEFINDIDSYISHELEQGAILGPFDEPQFTGRTNISLLSSRPKKQSKRRVK